MMKRRTFIKNVTLLSAGVLASVSGLAQEAPVSICYDAVIFGATPSGIAAAIRMAREGYKVLLVSVFEHIGGMLTNGLSMMDTLYEGQRAPLYNELLIKVQTYYADLYGSDSENARLTRFSNQPELNSHPKFESKVMLKLLTGWVADEKNITLLRQYEVASVERRGKLIQSVRFRSFENKPPVSAAARVFIDCSYEGDLMAQAGAAYVVGRESRGEFGEQYAGKIFVKQEKVESLPDASLQRLNLHTFGELTQEIKAGSTGAGDRAVQAYNMRFVLSADPANRRPIEKPVDYDRKQYLALMATLGADELAVKDRKLMNRKISGPGFADYVGQSRTYPEAGWSERRRIIKQHIDYGLGLLYFLQTDVAVPEEIRQKSAQYGLALDEFADNGNVPYEVYVREARRMRGRYVFTENDASLAAGIDRTPIHADSSAVTEWMMDSHACTTDYRPGPLLDGEMLLVAKTRPSQVPYRTLLPKEIDNLLVPGCLSATHIGFGAIRVEPTLMHLAESAAWAGILALRDNKQVSDIAVPKLQKLLVEHGIMLSFFNEFDMATEQPWVKAVQYFGTKGFFAGYNADPDRKLSGYEADIWLKNFRLMLEGKEDAANFARLMKRQPAKESARLITVADFINNLGSVDIWYKLTKCQL